MNDLLRYRARRDLKLIRRRLAELERQRWDGDTTLIEALTRRQTHLRPEEDDQ